METLQAPLVPTSSSSTPQPETPRKESTLPLPTILQHHSSTPPQLITQGAEALLFKTTYLLPTLSCALKYRPPKPYRHAILDARLTRHRILSEARVLVKSRRDDVPVPGVYALDEARGWIMMEWIEGEVVRVRLNNWLKKRKEAGAREGDGDGALRALMQRVGRAVGKLHKIGVVHGDLTTSNLMLRDAGLEPSDEGQEEDLEGDIVLIDFGLASQSELTEDRAVDLYVLERAFGSTHPRAESLFGEVLKAYEESFKEAKQVLKKLENVRMRGRKRSMLG